MPRHTARTVLCSALAFTLAAAVPAAPALALDEPIEMVVSEDGDHKTLTQSVIVDAPVADVWAAFVTEEGYSSWAVPHVKIDLRIGGMMESSYGESLTIGDPANIKNQIVAFVPERMLVLKNVQAPAGFAARETMDRLTSVFEFEQVSENQTRVTVHGIGYGSDEESLKLIEFFKVGNAWSFQQLQKKFPGD
ncbi:SRPBCC family protein [Paraurantiacibacter namhicola]|uniref:Activator of Hsp90 ATPase homologue 1/2-like C-terminal domain-containing protein n=1 Tax=Paraurantiacibacter namhicola TaxID=645517 RepID=A0A1C7DA70_9SPHN|nr:SRPBCC domain-containing protein [Paraurantiacibacter namhicola]ANU08272.1 hypothetical protein A6F65_01982 [Paraurantiacibacter namhicola]